MGGGVRMPDGSLKDSCLDKVKIGEPFFVLRGNDLTAPWVVRQWAANAQGLGTPQAKIDDAMACATAMEEWAARHKGKIPD